jgi:MBOAT membrane-bound O-acyltransferase family protein
MVVHFMSHGQWALRHMAVLLSLRLLPFAVYGAFASASPLRRLVVVMAYATVPSLACRLGARVTIELIGLGSLYYLLVSMGIYRLSAFMAAHRMAAFIFLFAVLLLLPGFALPGVAIFAFMVVGWELLLSSYSYCVETSRAGTPQPTLKDCLFFLLVNPTLVYTARGTAVEGPSGLGGLARAGAGAALMFVNVALLRPLTLSMRSATALRWLPAGSVPALLAYGVGHFFTFYWAHAGLASIHIGLMRQAGFLVPERYRFPLAARSPVEFWRRWNTYVRVWLEAYVFLPAARHLARRSARTGPACAAIVTLIASGLLHDAYVFAGWQTFASFRRTQVFVGACALLGAWRLAQMLSKQISSRLGAWQLKSFDLFARVSARAGILAAVAGAAIKWG